MLEHDTRIEKTIKFSRLDKDNIFSTISDHPIYLENIQWKTVEHYFQANIVARDTIAEQIKLASTGEQAYYLGNKWYRRKKTDWKKTRNTLMTRAIYTKCQMYDDVKYAILDTNKETIIETSLYDHYWGIGRDQRGNNMLGKIWMDVRTKLHKEIKS